MTERLEDVWTSRDFPVLREVTRLIDGGGIARVGAVSSATGLDGDQVTAAGLALERRRLVTLGAKNAGGGFAWFSDVAGQAYLLTGLHPDGDDAFSRLIDGLRQAADETTDPDERSRIRRAMDGLLGMSREIGVGVATAVLTGQVS